MCIRDSTTLTAEGMEEPFSWTYSEQGWFVEQLAYPNGMTRVNTYEDSRDLLSVCLLYTSRCV